MKIPLCVTCAHHSGTQVKMCNIPFRLSPVDGTPIRWTCLDMRSVAGKCKPEGLLHSLIAGEPPQYMPTREVEGSPF